MSIVIRGPLCVLGRLLLCAIFFMAATIQNIPDFAGAIKLMEEHHVPMPQVMLVGATVFMIVGSVSIVIGYKARIGAVLLLIFLGLATYYFHNFWAAGESEMKRQMTVDFMKNLSIAGAMVFIIGNGPGPFSIDRAVHMVPRIG